MKWTLWGSNIGDYEMKVMPGRTSVTWKEMSGGEIDALNDLTERKIGTTRKKVNGSSILNSQGIIVFILTFLFCIFNWVKCYPFLSLLYHLACFHTKHLMLLCYTFWGQTILNNLECSCLEMSIRSWNLTHERSTGTTRSRLFISYYLCFYSLRLYIVYVPYV